MKRRLVIVTEIIAPYRIPLFNLLAQHPEVEPHVIFLAETDPGLRQWRVYKEEIRFSYEVLGSSRVKIAGSNLLVNRGVARALARSHPDVILCGGYNYVASWQALLWARMHSVPFLLWSESNLHELRRNRPLVEFMKTEFIHRCRGFVVPGEMAREYLLAHRVKDESIFTAPNAVDNDLFAAGAASARANAEGARREFGLPDRYFLFAGRLVREKGVFELLSAYAKLDGSIRQDIALVLAGGGACRDQLETQAAAIAPGAVRFPGFIHREQLAAYYALAEVLILPTYTEPWGLVVNEAMACGTPVILSRVAGCSVDLLKENWNGLLIAPQNVDSLLSAMSRLASDTAIGAQMGRNSEELISRFTAVEWCAGVAQAVEGSVRTND